MDYSSFSAPIWDEKHLKALLRLRQYPIRLIQMEPWHTWINQRGGTERVLDYLRNNPLPINQEQILNTILTHPDASADFYCSKLNLSPSAYFFRLKELIRSLLLKLNAWEAEPLQKLSRSSIPTNIPFALTPLIGADKSLEDAAAILLRQGTRLLTLTGPGGIGKTRLALAIGAAVLEYFPNGVFFIPLETIQDPALLDTQIARSLNIETVGVQSLREAIMAYLQERRILLILDNFEQLIQGRQIVSDLLQSAGNLKILVTSREMLNLYGEIRFIVPELTQPNPSNLPLISQVTQWPALDLFIQRVQARHPDFAVNEANLRTIVEICQRLGGLPLAIELAAAQVRLISPDQTLPQLEYGLKALRDISHDRPSRQKNLWDTIDWSYQLLPDSEKAVLRRLAVFGREWGLDAAQAVCQMDDLLNSLQELVDKSLLRYMGQSDTGEARFQMLQPVREYAFDQLDICAEAEQTQRRHARYFTEMVLRAEPAIGSPGQLHWARRIKQERENLQNALQWMFDRQEIEMVFSFLGAGWRYYNMLNMWDETKAWMERALTEGAHSRSAGRVKTLWGAAWLATHYKDLAQQKLLAEEGLMLARELGNKLLIGLLLQNVGDVRRQQKEYDQSMQLLEESLMLFREMDNKEEIAWALYHTADTIFDRGEHSRSLELRYESLAIFRAIGDQWSVASVLWQTGEIARQNGDYQLAISEAFERLSIYRTIGARPLARIMLSNLAKLLWQQRDFEKIQPILEESLALAREIGDRVETANALQLKGRLALELFDLTAARAFLEQAYAIFSEIGDAPALTENLAAMEQLALLEKTA